MTATLLVLGMIVAINPFRAADAAPEADPRRAIGVAGLAVLVLVVIAGALSEPLLSAVGVTGASARIAAGVAMLASAVRDLFVSPDPEPSLPGWRAGIVPLAFPVMFAPGVAMLAIAGASNRGVAVLVASTLPALVLTALAASAGLGRRLLVAVGGAAGALIATLVVLDGVYAI
jgi:small neutral amino acid transporter SnatA (MarC family)